MHTCAAIDISVVHCIRKRCQMDVEQASDAGLSFQNKIRLEMVETMDRLRCICAFKVTMPPLALCIYAINSQASECIP